MQPFDYAKYKCSLLIEKWIETELHLYRNYQTNVQNKNYNKT